MSDDPTRELPKDQEESFDGLVRVESLELAVEQKLKQTAPLSSQLAELKEYVAACFREIIERQTRMEARQDAIEKEIREIGRTLRRINLDLATALRNPGRLGRSTLRPRSPAITALAAIARVGS